MYIYKYIYYIFIYINFIQTFFSAPKRKNDKCNCKDCNCNCNQFRKNLQLQSLQSHSFIKIIKTDIILEISKT